MSILKTRNAYLPSAGAASAYTFDSFWTDTSQAITLPGVWDTPSGSAPTSVTVTASVTSLVAKILVAQFVFPAFGATMDFSTPYGALWVFEQRIPVWKAKIASTSGHLVGYTAHMGKVFTSIPALRYYVFRQLQTGVGLSTSLVGTFASNSSGTTFATSSTAPASTDVLVIELGAVVYSATGGGLGASGTVTFSFDDNQTVWDVSGSAAAGNSGLVIGWYGSPPAVTGGGAKYAKPLAPTRQALRMQSPSVPDRTTDILNGLIL